MFEKIFKNRKNPSISELQQIVNELSNTPWFTTLVNNAIQNKLDANHLFKHRLIDDAAEVNAATKAKVHEFMNSDQTKEIIDDHIKTYLTAILDNADIIDEIVQERVDAAGIEQVIQWNNVAYGMLLSRLEDIEKGSRPNAEVIKGLFGK